MNAVEWSDRLINAGLVTDVHGSGWCKVRNVRSPIAALGICLAYCLISCGCSPEGKENGMLFAFEDSRGLFGYKNAAGTVVLSARYQAAFTDTFARAIAFVADSAHGIVAIDRAGHIVLTPFVVVNGPDEVREGLFRYEEQGRIGFADLAGNKIIPARFKFAGWFREGRAAYCEECTPERHGELIQWAGGRWGFVDATGRTVIPAQYDAVGQFEGGRARVKKDGKMRFIDTNGREIE